MFRTATFDPHRTGRRALLTVVATQAIGIGVIIALLADIQDRFGYPTWSLGVITGVSFGMAFAAHLLLSPLADKGWERQLIMVGALLTIAALLWMAVASQLWHWILARSLLGAAEGALTSSARRTMLSWDPEGQGKALSSLFTALLAGFLIGPPLGALLNETGTAMPFVVPAVVVALVLPFLSKIHPAEYGQPEHRVSRRRLASMPGLTSGLILASSSWFLIGIFDAIWARYMSDLGADTVTIGLGFLVLVLPSVLLTPLAGRLADRMNPVRLSLTAAFIELPFIVGFGFASSVTALLGIAVVQAVVWSYLTPPAQAAVAKVSPPGQAAEAQGLLEAVGLVFAAVGALSGAPIYDAFGSRWLFGLAALTVGVAALIVVAMRGRWQSAFDPVQTS